VVGFGRCAGVGALEPCVREVVGECKGKSRRRTLDSKLLEVIPAELSDNERIVNWIHANLSLPVSLTALR